MKKPIRLLYADKHLNLRNFELIKSITKQEIELMQKLCISEVIGLGDEFTSRQAQPLFTLSSFSKLHQMYVDAKINRTCIVGNHSKVNYTAIESYMDEFKYHPNIKVIDTIFFEDIDGIRLHYVSYFDEKVNYKDYLNKAVKNIDKSKYNILLTHVLFNGGINNKDEKSNDLNVNLSDFSSFDKVLSGHIHNISNYKNFYYIGSCYQNNFGEDDQKGFTVLYSDGSHELVKAKFQEYHTIKLDLDHLEKKDVNNLKKQASGLIRESGHKVRFKIEGSEDKVKAIKAEEFTSIGIDIKKEHKVVNRSIQTAQAGEIVTYDDETIMKKFEEFCKQEDYENFEYGKEIIEKKLKENG
jgi:exonuclease SbcD